MPSDCFSDCSRQSHLRDSVHKPEMLQKAELNRSRDSDKQPARPFGFCKLGAFTVKPNNFLHDYVWWSADQVVYSQNSCLLLVAEKQALSLKLEMCVYMYICVCVCVHMCMCLYVFHVDVCVCVPCVCAWLHMCVHVCFVLFALSYVVLLY